MNIRIAKKTWKRGSKIVFSPDRAWVSNGHFLVWSNALDRRSLLEAELLEPETLRMDHVLAEVPEHLDRQGNELTPWELSLRPDSVRWPEVRVLESAGPRRIICLDDEYARPFIAAGCRWGCPDVAPPWTRVGIYTSDGSLLGIIMALRGMPIPLPPSMRIDGLAPDEA